MTETEDKEKIIGILISKTGYLDIFSILSIIPSAHLSRIARLINKTKSTILKTIDNMLKEKYPLIEIDMNRTINTRGSKKYYQLSEMGRKVDLYIDKSISDDHLIEQYSKSWKQYQNQEVYQKAITNEAVTLLNTYGEQKLRPYFNLGSELNYYFQRASTQSYLDFAKKTRDPEKMKSIKHIPFGIFFSSLKRIAVSNADQIFRIAKLTETYIKNLNMLEMNIMNENAKMIDEGKIKNEDLDHQIVFINLNPIIE